MSNMSTRWAIYGLLTLEFLNRGGHYLSVGWGIKYVVGEVEYSAREYSKSSEASDDEGQGIE